MAERARANPASLVSITVVLSVASVALFVYFAFNTAWSKGLLFHTLLLTGIAWVAEMQAVYISKRLHISSAGLPVLLGVFFLGPAPSAFIASISTIARYREKDALRIIYNFMANIAPVMLVAALFTFMQGPFGFSIPITSVSLGFVSAGIIVGVSWEIADFGLVSTAIRLRHKQRLWKLWRENFIPALPSQLIFLGVGLVIAAIYIRAGIVATVLFFIPILASQHFYRLLAHQRELLAEQKSLYQDLLDMNIGLAGALIKLIESKDHYTANHSAGVAMYCRDMAKLMGMSEDDQWLAHMSGLLHDLGKVGTPDAVLKKKGELTPQEWEQIKEHPTTAADVLSELASHKEIANIIRHHQENYDGSGYPDGLRGNEIPELSRMLAVADTYQALTSKRPYREAMSPFEALIHLRKIAGTQLDPKYVEVMAQVLKDEDLSYREASKTDFLAEFRAGRPGFKLSNSHTHAEEH